MGAGFCFYLRAATCCHIPSLLIRYNSEERCCHSEKKKTQYEDRAPYFKYQ